MSLAVLVAGGVAGCGDGDGGDRDAVVRVVVGAGDGHEYRFDMPDEVPAGPTRVAVTNDGREPHHAQVFRLDDGATTADLEAALATGDPAAALDVGTFRGGTGLVSPGEASRADAVLDLDPGRYVLLCFVPDAAGVPHVAHGMMRAFDVTAGDGEPDLPEADTEVVLADYRFEAPESLGRDSTVAVTNESESEAHEMVIGRLDHGATVEDVARALDDHAPMPATGVGGMQAILPGATERLQLDLAPGRYVLLCAVTSPDGTAHHQAGMIREVRVR